MIQKRGNLKLQRKKAIIIIDDANTTTIFSQTDTDKQKTYC